MTSEGRTVIAERGLTAKAVAALIPLMENVGFDQLAVVKGLLRNFFSERPWTAMDHAALAAAVGPPADPALTDKTIRRRLDRDIELIAGWVGGDLVLDVEVAGDEPTSIAERHDLSSTFAYGVVPQPTPNPRTLRFATRPTGISPSQTFSRGTADRRVAAVFDVDDDVIDVLVGPDFVAVSLRRPGRWPELLERVLQQVAGGFGGDDGVVAGPSPKGDAPGKSEEGGPGRFRRRRPTAVQEAWDALGTLQADRPEDLPAVLDAVAGTDPARRQVAAYLLARAPHDIARASWDALSRDDHRSVRRAALDAIVDAAREELRGILETALDDADGWIRWKAVNGLEALGIGPSRAAVEPMRDDADFRVRLEVTRVLEAAH